MVKETAEGADGEGKVREPRGLSLFKYATGLFRSMWEGV